MDVRDKAGLNGEVYGVRACGAASVRAVEQLLGIGNGGAWGHGGSRRVGRGGRCGKATTVALQGAATVPR